MKRIFFALIALLPTAAFAQSITITASPNSGTSPVTPSLTWSVTGASGCVASGGWSGPRTATGSQAQAAITETTTYTLTCAVAGDSSVSLTWIPPTQNTDNSPLTDLASYTIYAGASVASLAPYQTIPAPASSATLTGFTPGTQFFAILATNAAGENSDLSSTASKTFTAGSTITRSVTVTVRKKPRPPGSLTVLTPVAFEHRRVLWWHTLVQVGKVDAGTQCSDNRVTSDYYEISRDDVYFTRKPRANSRIVAQCA